MTSSNFDSKAATTSSSFDSKSLAMEQKAIQFSISLNSQALGVDTRLDFSIHPTAYMSSLASVRTCMDDLRIRLQDNLLDSSVRAPDLDKGHTDLLNDFESKVVRSFDQWTGLVNSWKFDAKLRIAELTQQVEAMRFLARSGGKMSPTLTDPTRTSPFATGPRSTAERQTRNLSGCTSGCPGSSNGASCGNPRAGQMRQTSSRSTSEPRRLDTSPRLLNPCDALQTDAAGSSGASASSKFSAPWKSDRLAGTLPSTRTSTANSVLSGLPHLPRGQWTKRSSSSTADRTSQFKPVCLAPDGGLMTKTKTTSSGQAREMQDKVSSKTSRASSKTSAKPAAKKKDGWKRFATEPAKLTTRISHIKEASEESDVLSEFSDFAPNYHDLEKEAPAPPVSEKEAPAPPAPEKEGWSVDPTIDTDDSMTAVLGASRTSASSASVGLEKPKRKSSMISRMLSAVTGKGSKVQAAPAAEAAEAAADTSVAPSDHHAKVVRLLGLGCGSSSGGGS